MSRLERLLRPRSIATFGGAPAERLIRQCDRMGFAGEIWPVHPRRETISGRKCLGDIGALPGVPDAAFIGVNRHLAVDIAGELSTIGAGGAICYASGFREAEGALDGAAGLQDRLLATAGPMPLIGPNCYGLINALDHVPLWPDQHGLVRQERGVAIVTQSSNIAINLSMQKRGLPIGLLMTAGNQAQTDLVELAMAALEDDRVTAIGLHMEGLGDLAAMERLATASRDKAVPIIVLKVGRSEDSRSAALSHTASLSGSDAAADALFQRLGLARVDSLPVFLEALKLLHVHGALSGNAICSMSCSGGEAALVADAVIGRNVQLKPLAPERESAVKATLEPRVRAANPLDYDIFDWADRERLGATFSAMMASGFDLSLLVLDYPRSDRCDGADWLTGEQALADAVAATGAPAALVTTLPENLPEERAFALAAAGIAPLCGIEDALAAIEASCRIGAAWARERPPALLPVGSTPEDAPAKLLDEAAAKAMLADHGIPVPPGRVAACAEDAVSAAAAIGYPVALKALGVAHKSEAGAVALGLADAAAVRDAANWMEKTACGFLVERMVESPVAELIVGVARDPVAGPVLTIGAGGVLVELLRDCATLILPTDRASVENALADLKIAGLMAGWRGRPAADMAAAVAAIQAIASFAEMHAGRLLELDVNPLMVGPEGTGAVAADALVRIREEQV